MCRLRVGWFWCPVALWLLTSACAPRATEAEFDSPNPAAKLYAIHEAGRQRDAGKIPALIEQLDSDDPAVRLYGIVALEKITGTRLGYSPYDPPWRRTPAIERWVEAYHNGRFDPAGPDRAEPGEQAGPRERAVSEIADE